MRGACTAVLAALVVALWPGSTLQAGVRVGIGVGFGPGFGYYGYRPYYPPIGVGVGFYRPYYPYYAAPPVVVTPPPVIVQSAPPPVAPSYTAAAPPAALSALPAAESGPRLAPTPLGPPQEVTQAVASAPVLTGRPGDVPTLVGQLRSQQEEARMDALTQLGQTRAAEAVSPMIHALEADSSPRVREAAARALGLMGMENALPALQHAALDDSDRDVRHSASYAAEVIRNSLRQSGR